MMMSEPIFHPTSRQHLDAFVAHPSHAFIIVGPEGSGKSATSRWLALQLLQLANEADLANFPYLKTIEPDGQSISIEAIRNLQQFTKLKVAVGSPSIRRIAIINQAHLLTTEAQNALLKLLEEPPDGTAFILTAADTQGVLPTIRSRSQIITLLPPKEAELRQYFAKEYVDADIQRAHLMSGGLPGLMSALLAGRDDHPLVLATTQARELLQLDSFGRLALVDALAKQRIDCLRLLFMLQQMAYAALQQAAGKNLGRWQRVLRVAYEAEVALQHSAQPKLVLTNLMLNL